MIPHLVTEQIMKTVQIRSNKLHTGTAPPPPQELTCPPGPLYAPRGTVHFDELAERYVTPHVVAAPGSLHQKRRSHTADGLVEQHGENKAW